MSYRFIPTRVHGWLDYIAAITLIFAPTIFGFTNVGGAAVAIPMILGVLLFLYSLFTRYEVGLVRVIGFPIHLVIDLVAAAFLALSPFIFGFVHHSANVWVPHLVAGIVVVLVVLFSQTQPRDPALRTDRR